MSHWFAMRLVSQCHSMALNDSVLSLKMDQSFTRETSSQLPLLPGGFDGVTVGDHTSTNDNFCRVNRRVGPFYAHFDIARPHLYDRAWLTLGIWLTR